MWNWGCGVQEILSAWPGSAVASWQLLADHEVFRPFTLETVKMEYDMTERITLIERHQRYLSYIILSYTHVNLQSHFLETTTFHSKTNPIAGLYISHRYWCERYRIVDDTPLLPLNCSSQHEAGVC